MKYILHKDPNTGVISVPGPSLARTHLKAAKVAYSKYSRKACRDGSVRIVDIYGRTPVWERHGCEWDNLSDKNVIQRVLGRYFDCYGVTPESVLTGNPGGDPTLANAQGQGQSSQGQSSQGQSSQGLTGRQKQVGNTGRQNQNQSPSIDPAALRKALETAAQGLTDKSIAEAVATYLTKHPPAVTLADPATIRVSGPRGTKTVKGLRHRAFEQVLKVLSCRPRATLMTGPAGCGKTRMAAQVAEALGLKFYTINMSEGVTEGVMFGQRTLNPDGSTGWQDGIVTEAFEGGGLLFVDEMDNADPNLMVGLNQILDGSQVVSMAHRVHKPMAKRHDDFVVMCGANTLLSGCSEYTARNSMDGATVDRFMGAVIPVDYDRQLEANLIQDHDALKIMWAFRDFIAKSGAKGIRSSTRFGDTLNTLVSLGADYMIDQCRIMLDNETLASDFIRHLKDFDMEAYRNG